MVPCLVGRAYQKPVAAVHAEEEGEGGGGGRDGGAVERLMPGHQKVGKCSL
jgi:hypothetical protein